MRTTKHDMDPLDDTALVTATIRQAVRDAIEEQYRAGLAITVWRDGRKVVIPPEEIPALLAAADEPVEHGPAPAESQRLATESPLRR